MELGATTGTHEASSITIDAAVETKCYEGHPMIAENKANQSCQMCEEKPSLTDYCQYLHCETCMVSICIHCLPSFRRNSLLLSASDQGNIEEVRELLSSIDQKDLKRIRKPNDGRTPFYIACENGHLEIAKLFAGIGVDVDEVMDDGYTAIFVACANGHFDVVKYLLETACANIFASKVEGWTPLMAACQSCNVELVRYLKEEVKLDFSVTPSPLDTACAAGAMEIVKYLVEEAHIDFEIVDDSGMRAIHTACLFGRFEIVKYLREVAGADMHLSTNDGWNLFFITCCDYKEFSIETAEYIRRAGVDINEPSNGGETIFYFACEVGDLRLVTYLRETASVDINKPNNNLKTPLYVACEKGHKDIVKYLRSGHHPYADFDAQTKVR